MRSWWMREAGRNLLDATNASPAGGPRVPRQTREASGLHVLLAGGNLRALFKPLESLGQGAVRAVGIQDFVQSSGAFESVPLTLSLTGCVQRIG